MALVRRSTTPRLEGPTRRMPVRAQVVAQAPFPCQSLAAGFREAVGEHGRHFDPEAAAFLDRLDRSLRRRHDIGVIGDLRQRRERGPGALAQHALASGIDRIDAARIAHLPQEFQRPPGGFAGVVGLPDDGDAVQARTAPGADRDLPREPVGVGRGCEAGSRVKLSAAMSSFASAGNRKGHECRTPRPISHILRLSRRGRRRENERCPYRNSALL